jgi:hypothetical protein
MAFIIKDRVKEITTSTGTGALSLGGASSTFDQFQTYMSNGDTTYYAIASEESGVDEWEVGIGTWNTGNTLTRTTILAGSNSTSAVNFTAGDKQVFMTYPAAKAAFFNADGDLELTRDPQTALQAATKEYVDTIAAAGIHYHDPVRVEQEGNLSATYSNGTAGVGATLTNNSTQAALSIDGVTLSLNDRVLIYEQTNSYENGIYTVTDTGSASTNWVLTRATDADSYGASDPDALGQGDAFFVLEGAAGAGELYVMNTEGAITFGTTGITFTQVAATAVYTAGDGLTLTGTEFSIGAGTGVTVGASSVSIGQAVSTSDTPTFAGLTSTANISLGDDDKVLLGASNDLEIYHEGATGDSHIVNNGSGILNVSSQTNFDSKIDIDNNVFFGWGGGTQRPSITGDKTANQIDFYTGGFPRVRIQNDGLYLAQLASYIIFEGSTADGHETFLTVTDPTADRTITFPDLTGTVALSGATQNVDFGTVTADKLTLDGYADIQISSNNLRIDTHTSGTGIIYNSRTGYHTFKDNDVNVGQFRPGGDFALYEDTGTTAKFFWDASAESLGIGTSSPSSYHANADNLVIQDSGNAGITIATTDSAYFSQINFADGTSGAQAYTGILRYAHSDNSLRIIVNTGEKMRIDSSGNVGIGTSSPASQLHVKSTSDNIVATRVSTNSVDALFQSIESASLAQIGTVGSHAFTFFTANQERMRIDSSGNVGVGTSSPSAVLHANGSSQGDVYFRGETGSTKGLLFSTFNVNSTDHAGHNINAVSSVGEISFSTGSNERIRLDSSGNLLVGTTINDGQSIGAGTQDGTVIAGTSQYIQRGDNANLWLSKPSGATNTEFIKFYNNSSLVGTIEANGTTLEIVSQSTNIHLQTNGGTSNANNNLWSQANIKPWNNNYFDLGVSNYRWKDLYLAGSLSDGTTSRTVSDIVGLTSSQFLRSDADDTATGKIVFGSPISAGSIAKLQVGGFQRTGPIMLAVGTTNTASFNTTNERWLMNDGTHLYASTSSTSYNNKIWTDGNDGSGSGLDADTLDGVQGSSYLRSDADDTFTGTLTVNGDVIVEDNRLYVGDYSGDDMVGIIKDSTNSRGFSYQHTNAAVFANLQGSTEQYLVLGDTDTSSTSTLLGVSTYVGGTYYTRLILKGNGDLDVKGALTATSKSFVIDHPTKEGMKLRYGSLEGPEDGVYVRGRLTGETVIELPDYWTGLVHEDSITVQLTAMGGKADLWVESIADNKVTVGCDTDINCFYFIQATRKDVDAWDVEYEA